MGNEMSAVPLTTHITTACLIALMSSARHFMNPYLGSVIYRGEEYNFGIFYKMTTCVSIQLNHLISL